MRGERTSKGYEVVFVITEQQRDIYADAIRQEGVEVYITKTKRFGTSGFRLDVRYRADEDPARRGVNGVIHDLFPVGTRVRSVVELWGHLSRPVGTEATVTSMEGYASPKYTWDGESVEYITGPWWFEPVAAFG